MIRINLLSNSNTKAGPRVFADLRQKVFVGCSAILVAALIVMGWQYWSIRQRSSQIENERIAVNQESLRLNQVLADVHSLETERDRLALRVDLIEGLRREQLSPVRMLDEISLALPDGLWLSVFEQKDRALIITGQSVTLGALSDFVANLETSGFFGSPVEIIDSQMNESEDGDLVQFEVKALLNSVGSYEYR